MTSLILLVKCPDCHLIDPGPTADWEKWIVGNEGGVTTFKGRSGNIGYLSILPDGSITYTDVSDLEDLT